MSHTKPAPLEMAYIALCNSFAVISFKSENGNGNDKVCVCKDPWKRMLKEFPARRFNQLVDQIIWVADEQAGIKIKSSPYLEKTNLSKTAKKEGVRFFDNEVMVQMAARVVDIAQEELEVFKKTGAYKAQRKHEREAIQTDRLLNIRSRTMRDFDDRLVKQIIKRKLEKGN